MAQDVSDDENISSVAKKNRARKSGGFQSMGLDFAVLKGVLRKGYKIPTPIQRKTIPLISSGKDVVAMARTGSGKTAAFLVPLLQKLKRRQLKAGARALLISPTRELALQTLKFTRDLGKFTDLKISLLVGGDSMEEQFAAIHENPDIIIATPGRLVHVAVEMNLKLSSVEYVVFDEADRLFEMGFAEQLKEILARLPESRQTLLFSATLPRTLVDFVKAGLNDPTLVRLDVDSKISDKLQMNFLHCRFEDKTAGLLYLLRHVIDVQSEQTIVFCATKHHVEYLNELLTKLSIDCTFVYSALDPTARKINVSKFRQKRANVLLVTDLAARGVDIPLLDNVINVHFSPKPKLFVHRVGRVARAGRSGRAFSLISVEEMPYVIDLFLFLGRSLNFVPKKRNEGDDVDINQKDSIGSFPRDALEIENECIRNVHDGNADLEFLRKGSINAYKQYVRTRPIPSRESVERVKKDHALNELGTHPIFKRCSTEDDKCDELKSSILDGLRKYKPKITVFELNTSNKDECWLAMKAKRKAHNKSIGRADKAANDFGAKFENLGKMPISMTSQSQASGQEIKNVFAEIIESKFRPSRSGDSISNKNKAKKLKRLQQATSSDSAYFIPYQPKDFHQEQGLSMQKSAFEQQASSDIVDFTTDETGDMHRQKNKLKWDRKRKKFVREDQNSGKNKKIKTESGVWIPASYKSDLYAKWLKRSKVGHKAGDSDEDQDESGQHNNISASSSAKKSAFAKNRKNNKKVAARYGQQEMKSKEQILKERKRKERLQSYQGHKKRQKGSKAKSARKTR